MGRVVAFLLALVVAACAGTPRPPPPIADQLTDLQRRLFIIVEEKRHRLEPRAKPLMLDPQLSEAAQAHADAMAKAGRMEAKDTKDNPAMKALMADPKFQGFVAENVGQQFYHASQGIDVRKFAQTFLELWLKGTDQTWNISFRGFNRTGIGVATNGKAIFVSQIFSTDFGLPPRPDDPADTPGAAPETSPGAAPGSDAGTAPGTETEPPELPDTLAP
jgi:uncharacterized protein YkwD